MDIHVLRSEISELRTCPVFILGDNDIYEPCDTPLSLMATNEIVGDDYGSWAHISVGFQCGHTIADMENSLRHAGEI